MKIFVSYTTRNNEVTVESLITFYNKLNSFGQIFIDLINNDSNDKQNRIIEELKKTDLLILIKSQSTFNSEWVKFELEKANELNIPLLIFDITEIEYLTVHDIEKRIHDPKFGI